MYDASERIHGIFAERTVSESIADWNATAFLGAGVLLLTTATLSALTALFELSIPSSWTGVIALTGLILSYLGLLGFYPRVVDTTPRLARTGTAFVVLPVAVLAVLTIWGTLGHTLSVVPLPITVIPAIGVLFVGVFISLALGTSLFGLASLRSDRLPQPVGLLLFVFAATWLGHLAASSVYGTRFPVWFDVVSFGVLAAVSLAIGYHLRIEFRTVDGG